MIVFLDFDGVTHGTSGATFSEGCLSLLNAVLTEHSARVVIISSWRDEMPLQSLVSELRQVGRHVIGVAPEEPAYTRTPRELVVRQWLAENGYTGPWLAIDDNPRWYGDLAPRVVATDPRLGFTGNDAERFRELVASGVARETVGEEEGVPGSGNEQAGAGESD